MDDPPRPPSILSEHGEGYCRYCVFVVGLDPAGMLARHWRGQTATECKGSGTRPPARTPLVSRKAMFRVTAKRVDCPTCKRSVPLLADGRMNGHTISASSMRYCPGGYNFPNYRDHSGERG